ncbi:hypothetical protein ARALYDRAFT_353131 [Arabidopsis lyrata subsp. lyrata]|uniref:F-box domain-containing protein n=1 Tax=Arabidopsis lyrata subsp. lyrata TaxID=81972 RepID=D7MB07_ARALL|nr:hypothetical protein ARALYDRAFT_353131 [Arabidopsis lyrata subsp. lyrata]
MSNSGAGEEPPRTKKLKLSSLPSTSEFSSLPDEIVLSCLARVPRSDYASLSLASKCLRSIVVSPEIYDVRSLIGCGDFDSKPRKWGEVFDPKTQTWDDLPMPPSNQYNLSLPLMFESAVMEEKGIQKHVEIEGVGGRILWCEAEELDWRIHEGMVWREVMGLKTLTDTLCASKLVNYGGRMSEHWKSCKRKMVRHGLTSDELDKLLPGHILSNSGPNMLLFWDVLSPKKLEIWCAEISLKRRKEGVEICGKIEWSEAVMTFKPPPLHQHHCKLLYSLPHNL